MFLQVESTTRSRQRFIDVSNGNICCLRNRMALRICDFNGCNISCITSTRFIEFFVIKQSLIIYHNSDSSFACGAIDTLLSEGKQIFQRLISQSLIRIGSTSQRTRNLIRQRFIRARNLIGIGNLKCTQSGSLVRIFVNIIVLINYWRRRRFVDIGQVHSDISGCRNFTIRDSHLESPSRLCFIIKLTTIRNNKFVRSILELKRHIGWGCESQLIPIRVTSGGHLTDTFAIRPITSIRLLFWFRKGLSRNRRSIIFVLDIDHNFELLRRLFAATCNGFRFCCSIIRNCSINNILLLCRIIQRNSRIDLERCILVPILNNGESLFKGIIIRARNVHQIVGIRINVSFIVNVAYNNLATSKVALFHYRKDHFIFVISRNCRGIVNRNNINSSRVRIRSRGISASTIANNFITKRGILIAKFISFWRILKLAKITYNNFLISCNSLTIQSQSTCRRETCNDNSSKGLSIMFELEFIFRIILRERVLAIFIDFNNKQARNRRSNILTYDIDFVTLAIFIIT